LARRTASLLIALAVIASGQSPCTVAALVRATGAEPAAGDAARQAAHHGDHSASAHGADPGDGTSTKITARPGSRLGPS
jgi:hypothetical protein